MKTKIMTLSLLMGLATGSFAAQCPSASDWSHSRAGQQWQLSKQAAQEGWLVSVNSDSASDYTTMPAQAQLYSELNGYGLTECVYYLNGSVSNGLVIAYSDKIADLTSLAQPPYEHMGDNEYQCTTQAGNADVCRWKWKS